MGSIRQEVFETNSSSSHVLIIGTVEEFNLWKNSIALFIWPIEGKYKLVGRGCLRDMLDKDGVAVNSYKDDELARNVGLPLFDVAVYRNYDALSYKMSQYICSHREWVNDIVDVTGKDSHVLFGWYDRDFDF